MTLPPLPTTLGRYKPEMVLGVGAMGVVYRARDPLIDRAVAIKVMRTDMLDDASRDEFLERFRREARAAARCGHPAVVAIYDFADDPKQPYIVMELVEGRTLLTVMRDPAARANANLPALLLPVLEGLSAAHAMGIVHRDIKPANIVITTAGHAKVMDFGIARMDVGDLTAVGGMVGTPSTMAPEQARGDAVDHRADLFAVGAILYDMLLGRPPFAGASMPETFAKLLGPEPAVLGAMTDKPYGPVLARALAKNPADRFASADEFAAALRLALAGQASADSTVVMIMPPPIAAPGPRFEASLLTRLAEDMAQTIGPVASTLVRREAERATSVDDLVRTLADRIEAPEARAKFLRRHRSGSATGSASGTGGRVSGSGSGSGAGSRGGSLGTSGTPTLAALQRPEVLEAARDALAHHVGPIAGVLVRRAAASATSIDLFLDALTAHIPKPQDIGPFRQRLRAKVDSVMIA